MYETYYGLSAKPFRLRPDPHFFFGSKGHKRAMAYLEYGLSQGEGFIVITGEVGTGKTTLARYFLSKLGPETQSAVVLYPVMLVCKKAFEPGRHFALSASPVAPKS